TGPHDDTDDVAVADLDGDGDLDVVVTSSGIARTGGKLIVHRNRGDGTFLPWVGFPTARAPAGVAVADFDGDGRIDVATADYGYLGQGTTVSILANDGAGGFRAPTPVAVPPAPYRLAVADVDGDGRQDLGVACEDQKLAILRNTGSGFTVRVYDVLPNGYAADVYPSVALGGLDHDGDPDAVYTSTAAGLQPASGSGAVAILRNDGRGVLGAPEALVTLPETAGGVDLAIADWNGDGWNDVASSHLFE